MTSHNPGGSGPSEDGDPESFAPGAGPVTVYSTPFCAPCEQLKRYLQAHDVPFVVRDLMMDEEAQDRLEAHNIRSTPALEVGGTIYAGEHLNPDRLKGLLKL